MLAKVALGLRSAALTFLDDEIVILCFKQKKKKKVNL